MRTVSSIIVLVVFLSMMACNKAENVTAETKALAYDSTNVTNDFFDDSPNHKLELNKLYVGGEVADSGYVDFSILKTHEIIVKETRLNELDVEFIGAYKYEGYSLHDILSPFLLKKKNAKEFRPMVDAYIEIENENGEKTVFSWGEVFYPTHRHGIIVANSVMRVVPVKSKKMWPLSTTSKIVAQNDLFTERNISKPVRITVKSYPKKLNVVKGLKPLFSPTVKMYCENKEVDVLSALPSEIQVETFHTIFYGKGRGLHSTEPYEGIYLKDYLKRFVPTTKASIQNGIIVASAKDGYRATFSFSEIANRNDQLGAILMCFPEANDNGIFRVYVPGDFFSDRGVKGLTEIWYSEFQK